MDLQNRRRRSIGRCQQGASSGRSVKFEDVTAKRNQVMPTTEILEQLRVSHVRHLEMTLDVYPMAKLRRVAQAYPDNEQTQRIRQPS
jgi:hypothetical protein